MLDLTGTKRRCITDSTCMFVLKHILTYFSTCIRREEWLEQDPHNFVDLYLQIGVYKKDDFPLTADKVCVNYDYGETTPMNGATFVADRICGCPSDNPETKYIDIRSDPGCAAGE